MMKKPINSSRNPRMQMLENKLRKMVREELGKNPGILKEYDENDVVKTLPIPNKEYMNRLEIQKYERISRGGETNVKYRINSGGGLSVSILDLLPLNKYFDTVQEAERYALTVSKLWSSFLDKYYRK